LTLKEEGGDMNRKLFFVVSVIVAILFLLIFQNIETLIAIVIAVPLSGFLIWIVGKAGEKKYHYLFKE